MMRDVRSGSVADQAQHDLQALLAAVEPSSAFVPGVRARIATGRMRSTSGVVLAWATVGAICAAVGVWAVVDRHVRQVPGSSVVVDAPLTSPLADTPVESVSGTVDASAAPSRATTAVSTPVIAEAAPVTSSDGRVLVPDDQRLALLRLLQGLREGRAVVPVQLVPIYDADGLIAPPKPVVVVPLGALVADPNDLEGGSLAPQPRKDER